jgi:hypothetical protein
LRVFWVAVWFFLAPLAQEPRLEEQYGGAYRRYKERHLRFLGLLRRMMLGFDDGDENVAVLTERKSGRLVMREASLSMVRRSRLTSYASRCRLFLAFLDVADHRLDF